MCSLSYLLQPHLCSLGGGAGVLPGGGTGGIIGGPGECHVYNVRLLNDEPGVVFATAKDFKC